VPFSFYICGTIFTTSALTLLHTFSFQALLLVPMCQFWRTMWGYKHQGFLFQVVWLCVGWFFKFLTTTGSGSWKFKNQRTVGSGSLKNFRIERTAGSGYFKTLKNCWSNERSMVLKPVLWLFHIFEDHGYIPKLALWSFENQQLSLYILRSGITGMAVLHIKSFCWKLCTHFHDCRL
jgi:hypothetical protein